jgi:hypothetical protein
LLAEQLQKTIKEMPRDPELIELLKKFSGVDRSRRANRKVSRRCLLEAGRAADRPRGEGQTLRPLCAPVCENFPSATRCADYQRRRQ